MDGFSAASRSFTSRIPYAHGARQSFHKPRTGLGAAGHWVHVAASLAPLAISELVEDAAKRRRSIAFISVGSALAYETLWTLRERERREQEQGYDRSSQVR
jgi:hypothetical protein